MTPPADFASAAFASPDDWRWAPAYSIKRARRSRDRIPLAR